MLKGRNCGMVHNRSKKSSYTQRTFNDGPNRNNFGNAANLLLGWA